MGGQYGRMLGGPYHVTHFSQSEAENVGQLWSTHVRGLVGGCTWEDAGEEQSSHLGRLQSPNRPPVSSQKSPLGLQHPPTWAFCVLPPRLL